ncbi:MAG TPA: shikimate dehydrogenase, partial [Pararhizobium sp.]|nr:shikimate dehydrogenase [Pararhizobium sp.]
MVFATATGVAGNPALLRLGLIGDNILDSRSPELHRIAGRLSGLDVTYNLLIPARLGKAFDAVFDDCRANGMRGLNITYPYKERALARVVRADPFIRALGSVNTVLFEADGPAGYNTDYSGFIAAWRGRFGETGPGKVVLIGAGGVGRAIAFALATLGATGLRIVDRDLGKAESLVRSLRTAFGEKLVADVVDAISGAMEGVDGIVNCTPMGMSGHPGSAVPAAALIHCRWAFDAVYTPVETEFMRDCEAAGVSFLS